MEFKSRKYDRFITCENAFAALGRNYSKIGKIKDISLGGLAFEYIAAEVENLTISDVDVFLSNSIFHLYNLPCRVIYDIKIHSPYVEDKFRQMLLTKRCGIKFQKLNKDAELQLKFFLQAHTAGLAGRNR